MQSRSEYVKALREILSSSKAIFCVDFKEDPFKGNRELYGDTISAFHMIGEEKIYELVPDIYQFVNCNDTVLRETAVTTLGLSSRLHLPEFKETAYKIWLEDKSYIVRNAALRAWSSYYDDSKDSKSLKILYEILLNENIKVDYRLSAMEGILDISGEKASFYDPYQSKHFYMINSHEEFNKKIDWEEIKAIIKKYAPDALDND